MKKQSRRRRVGKWILLWILFNVLFIAVLFLTQQRQSHEHLEKEREQMHALKGENKEIAAGTYNVKLAAACDNGIFVGSEQSQVRSYKGIPYACPPVDDLRWKPPVDAPKSGKVFEALYFGKSGIQTVAESERASMYLQGEDCLTLNVWTGTEGDTQLRPVMVFFPGGAYGWGGTADPMYDGQNFVEAHKDVVLVTVNYRIGIMGFMDLSQVEGGEDYAQSGNLGLLDQICALRWIQRNIRSFGGDPDQVTIFGESAGAGSASLLPLIGEAKGLFKRVIAQSGSIALTFSREECQTQTRMLLKEAKASSMKELLALSEQELMRINEKLNDYNNFPERDGVVLPEDLYGAYAEGGACDVEMLTGTNADEIRYYIGEVGGYPVYMLAARLMYGSILDRLKAPDRSFAEAFVALQGGDLINPVDAISDFFTDLLFRGPAIRQAQLHALSGGRHYMYLWTKRSDLEHYRACHAVELAYVFNNTDDTIYTGSKADEQLARTVQDMWVNFAKTGDPSVPGHTWAPYDAQSRQTMILGDEIRLEEDPLPQRRSLIEPLLDYRFNGQYKAADYALLYLKKRLIRGLCILAGINALIGCVIFLRKRIGKHG